MNLKLFQYQMFWRQSNTNGIIMFIFEIINILDGSSVN